MAQLGEKMNLYVVFVNAKGADFVMADSLKEARERWDEDNNPYGYEGHPGAWYSTGGRLATAEEIAAYENGCDFADQPVW